MDYGITDILTLLGALGLFLYGMKVMSDALLELAGERMRSILSTTTSNRFFAVLTGFTITAVIQSSSATTLMVISFTNAGLLTLREAIGVIMGANIGTTVTAWLISIFGFKVSISAMALPLVGLGFLLTLLKKKQHQHWGYFVIGFAVLFIGLQFLKDAVPDIRSNPDILAVLSDYTSMGFLSILLFLLIGTLLTVVVQSSSAAMALTLLMTYEGWIPGLADCQFPGQARRQGAPDFQYPGSRLDPAVVLSLPAGGGVRGAAFRGQLAVHRSSGGAHRTVAVSHVLQRAQHAAVDRLRRADRGFRRETGPRSGGERACG